MLTPTPNAAATADQRLRAPCARGNNAAVTAVIHYVSLNFVTGEVGVKKMETNTREDSY